MWRSLIAQALDSLGTGLETLLLNAHLERIFVRTSNVSGTPAHDSSRLEAELRDLLNLPDPDARNIEDSILLQFGIVRESILVPEASHFTAKSKPLALGGNGRGEPVRFEGQWDELSAMLNTVKHILNSRAHPHVSNREPTPPTAVTLSKAIRGSLYATTKDGQWRVQMPHAATALRIFVAVFNSLYYCLNVQSLSLATETTFHPDLRSPDIVLPFPASAREDYH